ncbi:MAG TPA: acyltransferase [Cyclobacteriaceae bacterium]|nr:acyltransferase [Cyclobacteriaceae bacterium]
MNERRFDIDWLRVIAIGLLLIYHVAIAFQPWGVMIGFPTNKESWTALWAPMSMLNIWRIPLLFFVSGMGVYFALQRRNWKELITERAMRILVPFIFGVFVIVPIHVLIWRYYYNMALVYSPDPGHLWFLRNIFVYVLVLSPLFFYLKHNEGGKVVLWTRKVFSHPLGLLLVIGCFTLEAMILKPNPYELYAMTWHGWALGLLAFLFGFCFVLSGEGFLKMIVKGRWAFVAIAVVLFIARITYFHLKVPYVLLVTESDCWIFSLLAFGYKYLNHGGKALSYLSKAAYPVYILHMIFLYLGGLWLFPLDIPVSLKFVALLVITGAGCFLTFEFVIRRLKWIGLLFGVK